MEAINKLTDKKFGLIERVKTAVIDQTDSSTFYLNIPAKPDLEDMELNEEQLELVAGGGDDLENAKNLVKASLHISSFGLINLL